MSSPVQPTRSRKRRFYESQDVALCDMLNRTFPDLRRGLVRDELDDKLNRLLKKAKYGPTLAEQGASNETAQRHNSDDACEERQEVWLMLPQRVRDHAALLNAYGSVRKAFKSERFGTCVTEEWGADVVAILLENAEFLRRKGVCIARAETYEFPGVSLPAAVVSPYSFSNPKCCIPAVGGVYEHPYWGNVKVLEHLGV